MNITVFQALTLLAQKYRCHPEMYSKIKAFYLSGIKTSKNLRELNLLLDDELLKSHTILEESKDINDDPVRRYFESHLCHETLIASLDALDYHLLDWYHDEVIQVIKFAKQWDNYQNIFLPPLSAKEEFYDLRMENTEGIRILNNSDSYQTLKPKNMVERDAIARLNQRKKKLLLVAKISYASWFVANTVNCPLSIYHPNKGPFNTIDRGRIDRVGQTVQSQTLGIMRSYMPLSQDDALLSSDPARYIRPVDQRMYVSGAKQPENGFESRVSPFCNSISGTMLIQLRVIALLMTIDSFIYGKKDEQDKKDEQLGLYFKIYISYMIYHSGGHSLDEYARVFELMDIKEYFKNKLQFKNLTLDHLFKDENGTAFEEAVSKTIIYGDHILRKKQLSASLASVVQCKVMSKKTQEQQPLCASNKLGFFHHQANKLSENIRAESSSPVSIIVGCESSEK